MDQYSIWLKERLMLLNKYDVDESYILCCVCEQGKKHVNETCQLDTYAKIDHLKKWDDNNVKIVPCYIAQVHKYGKLRHWGKNRIKKEIRKREEWIEEDSYQNLNETELVKQKISSGLKK